MLRLDDVESLSRLLSGDLSEPEAAQLRARLRVDPELRVALERLRTLEAMTVGQGAASDTAFIGRAVARAVQRRQRRVWVAAGVAAAAVIAVAVGWTASLSARVEGPLHVDGRPATRFPPVGANVTAVNEACRLTTRGCDLAIAPATELVRLGDDEYELKRGTLVATGKAELVHADDRVLVSGRTIVSTEPEMAFAHATPPVVPNSWTGGDMSKEIGRWNAAATAVGAALAVWVVDGRAEVRASGEPARMLAVGESWSRPREASSANPTTAKREALLAAKTAPSKALRSSSSAVRSAEEELDLEQINARVVPLAGELARCFTSGQQQDAKLEGRLEALLTIDGKGRVTESTIAGNYSLNQPFVASCILQVLSGITYPAPKSGQTVQLSYPLEFRPRGAGGEALGSMVVFPGPAVKDRPTYLPDREGRSRVEVGNSPTRGAAEARVTIVEFSEAECSFCVKGHAVMKQLAAEYAGRVRFAYKHRPLDIHVNSRPAALAAAAAYEQGKFWEYLDRVYAEPTALDSASLERHAIALGLDMPRFRACIASSGGDAAISADEAQAELLGVKGVPSYYVNGREVVGVRPIEQFRAIIDEELKRAGP